MADLIRKAQEEFFDVIRSLEKSRKSRIFCLVQDFRIDHLCTPDLRSLIRTRDQFDQIDTLEILLHTPGGHADIAYRMARFFRRHCKRLHFIVPISAKSAGTIMCLAADRIYMGELAELGPLDVQITDELEKGIRPFSPLDEFKSMDFLKEYSTEFLDFFSFALKERGMSVKEALHEAIPAVTGMMAPLYAHIDPSKVGRYRRSLAEGEEYARRLLSSTGNPVADDLVEHLVWRYPEHSFVIDYSEAKEIGLPAALLDVKTELRLVPAMLKMVNYGLPYVGFAPKLETKKQNKSSKPAQKPSHGRKPTLVRGKKLPASSASNLAAAS